MTEAEIIDHVAKAIWGSPANKRVVSWESIDQKAKDLWRDDAKRAIDSYVEVDPTR
jgi:hypothetical protein